MSEDEKTEILWDMKKGRPKMYEKRFQEGCEKVNYECPTCEKRFRGFYYEGRICRDCGDAFKIV